MREDKYDFLKFLLIALVCFGHIMQISLSGFDEGEIAFYKLIYTFHVPLFAFLSGYFTNSEKNYTRSFLPLTETIILGSIFWLLLCDKPITIISLICPQYHLWYLMGLIWWRTILHYTTKYISKRTLLIVSLLGSISIAGLPDVWFFSASITMTQFPFFVVGNMCRENKQWLNKLYEKRAFWGAIPFLVVYVIYYYVPDLGHEAHHMPGHGVLWMYVDRITFLLFAFVLGASLLLINSKINHGDWFIRQGRKNMVYYVYHGFMRFGVTYIISLGIFELNILSTIAFTVLTLGVICFISNIRITTSLLAPFFNLYVNLQEKNIKPRQKP